MTENRQTTFLFVFGIFENFNLKIGKKTNRNRVNPSLQSKFRLIKTETLTVKSPVESPEKTVDDKTFF